ncbi:MAG: hypothetical protein SGBAC_012991 [Bacillariaceae sp.]
MNAEEKNTTFCESSLQRKKSVQFADRQEVHDVLRRRSQISRQSMQGIWFDGEDFSDFVEDMEKCVDKMENGKRLKDKKYSSLGLESLTEEGSAIRQAHKENAWDAVLWEQEYQREEGKRSSIQIAEAYIQISRESQLYAHEQAQHVHEEVENYLLSWDDAYLPRDSNHSKELVPEEHHKAERRRSSSVPRRTRVSVC